MWLPKSSVRPLLKATADGDRDYLVNLHSWLHETAAPLHQKVVEARALVSEELWERYKLLGIKGLAEQDIFNNAKKDFITLFKERLDNDPQVQSQRAKAAARKSSLAARQQTVPVPQEPNS
jgi:hypothetical protein